MNAPLPKPLIVFDGDCGFCRRWARRWQNRTGDAVDYEPSSQAAARFPEISGDVFAKATTLITPDGQVFQGAQAVFKALAAGQYQPQLAWGYSHLPGVALVSEFAYRLISRNRGLADFLDRFLFGKQTGAPTYILTRQIFLRLLGVIYLIAFLSMSVQVDGLIGSKGILPMDPYLKAIAAEYGSPAHFELPTLLWFSATDHTLHLLCGGGIAMAVLLILGILPIPMLIALWAFYLSLSVGGQEFLGFQWDALLLEAGFVAIFFAPLQLMLWPRPLHPPSSIALFLLRWILFRVMFLSAIVKLTSGDPTWRGWTALKYHYQTQPLPTWTSWYFHHLPDGFQSYSVGFTFLAELIAPLLIFSPRRLRLMSFWVMVVFQSLILATGNFGFFNLLTLVLCITLLDDPTWPAWLRRRAAVSQQRRPALLTQLMPLPLAALILILTAGHLYQAFYPRAPLPASIIALESRIAPFRSINSYGLFRVMTTERPEIIIEGSNDGEIWKSYEFKWKPGDLRRPPQFCTPNMPRLDWQMWFAAPGDIRGNPWFVNFLIRLLQGSPPVLDLMADNPFPDHPPRYVRALLYRYEFTSAKERRESGNWWKRELLGLYCRPISLQDVRE